MSRAILIYGQPASGKSYSMRNLNPKTTLIIDADKKNGLPWRGWKKNFCKDNRNYVADNKPTTILSTFQAVSSNEKYKQIKTIVIDGLNTTMNSSQLLNETKGYEKWTQIATDIYRICDMAKSLRDDLTIIITAHVELADPNQDNSVDHVKTPGNLLGKINIESLFQYVFYAKRNEDGEHFFETQPVHSTARSPEGCFETIIPNDLNEVINTINKYELGE